MHEISLMEQTLTIILETAHQENATKIHRLNMRVGAVSGVVPEALQFAFDVTTQGTIAAAAELNIELVPTLCHCTECNQNFAPIDLIYQCEHCGSLSNKIIQGKEIEIVSLEIF